MKKIKLLLEPTKNKIIGTILLLILGSLVTIGFIKALEVPDPAVTFNETKLVFEYGENLTEFKVEGLGVLVNKEDSVYDTLNIEKSEFKTNTVGTFKTEFIATLGNVEKHFEVEYSVEDTQAPVLENVVDLEFEEGSEFSHTIKATDPVDGELEVIITGDYDLTVPAEYTLTATVTDKHENETKGEFKVTVTPKPEPEPEPVKPTPPTSNNSGNASPGNKPGNNGNDSASNNNPTPTPTPDPKPTTPVTPPVEDMDGLIIYKKYDNFKSCQLVMNDVLDKHAREWRSNMCDYDGTMLYRPN